MNKKIISIILILLLMASALPTFAVGGGPSSWAELGVNQMLEQKLIPLDLQSDYQKNITRGEFARLLIPAMEAILRTDINGDFEYEITKEPFSDTSETNVMKAYSSNIIGGIGNNKFNPNGLITREQVAIMMVNAVDSIEMLSYITKKPTVTDDKDISSWAKAYVYAALNNGLMNGTGNGNYAPKGNVTREQAILMVNNVVTSFLDSGSIYAHKTLMDTQYENYLAELKSMMIWKLLGSKPIKTDLATIIDQDINTMTSLFGVLDYENYIKFSTVDLSSGGTYVDSEGNEFIYDTESYQFVVYGLSIYHNNGKVIGFTLDNNTAFDGSISGYQTSYLYNDAVAFLGNTEKFDDGSALVYGDVDGYHINLVFDDITKSSISVTIVKLQ